MVWNEFPQFELFSDAQNFCAVKITGFQSRPFSSHFKPFAVFRFRLKYYRFDDITYRGYVVAIILKFSLVSDLYEIMWNDKHKRN